MHSNWHYNSIFFKPVLFFISRNYLNHFSFLITPIKHNVNEQVPLKVCDRWLSILLNVTHQKWKSKSLDDTVSSNESSRFMYHNTKHALNFSFIYCTFYHLVSRCLTHKFLFLKRTYSITRFSILITNSIFPIDGQSGHENNKKGRSIKEAFVGANMRFEKSHIHNSSIARSRAPIQSWYEKLLCKMTPIEKTYLARKKYLQTLLLNAPIRNGNFSIAYKIFSYKTPRQNPSWFSRACL